MTLEDGAACCGYDNGTAVNLTTDRLYISFRSNILIAIVSGSNTNDSSSSGTLPVCCLLSCAASSARQNRTTDQILKMDVEERVPKRPRLDSTEQTDVQQATAEQPPQQLGPSIQSLFQVPAGIARQPSPGAMHGCRIAAWAQRGTDTTYCCAIASGPIVYWSQVALQQHAQPEQGKEGILLPKRLQTPAVVQLPDIRHAGEVQALSITACSQDSADQQQQVLLLGTVDAFGCGSISRLQLAEQYSLASTDAATAAATAPTVVSQVRLQPQDRGREGGWAGVCFSSSSSDEGLLVAAARSFANDISLYDATAGSIVRTFNCCLNPYALKFLPPGIAGSNGQLLAVAEAHMVSLWDARAAGGCVQRLATASVGQPLYALDWCTANGGLLGSAGAERSVFLTEPRKWKLLTKWNGATRLAIHSLSFLETDPHYAVLGGLDMEVLCGRWDKPGNNSRMFQSMVPGEDVEPKDAAAAAAVPAAPGAPGSGDRTRGNAAAAAGGAEGGASSAGFSFRGDARWLGVSKAAGVDVLAGFAASGNLVYARVR